MNSNSFYVHQTALVDAGAQIGNGTRIWQFCHLMPRCIIGEQCVVGQNVFIDNEVVVGNGVKIQNNVSLYHGVMLEDDVFVGPSAVFTNVINPRSFIERKQEFRQTIVEKGATIGANATIVCGVRIGAYAMIGAGSVVTKDVAPYGLAVGNPARQKGWMSKAGYKLVFNAAGKAICPGSGDAYTIQKDAVFLISVIQ